ncbi:MULTISPECIES: hypothetical protein [Sphingobacterium]|uniref:hypothetical protein n=1 Tax=Sphingobacterium TaxID=28453 RepID=UPI002579BA18|nr:MULTISPECIES: hypothetical protein [Sphingobacterium]
MKNQHCGEALSEKIKELVLQLTFSYICIAKKIARSFTYIKNGIPYSVNEFTHQILHGIADEVCTEKYGESTGIY